MKKKIVITIPKILFRNLLLSFFSPYIGTKPRESNFQQSVDVVTKTIYMFCL